MLNALEFWMTRLDNDWNKCDILFAYARDNVFVPIEQIDIGILNKVAQAVPLNDGMQMDNTTDKPKANKDKKEKMWMALKCLQRT